MKEFKKSYVVILLITLIVCSIIAGALVVKEKNEKNAKKIAMEEAAKRIINYNTLTEVDINEEHIKDAYAKVSKADDFIFKYAGFNEGDVPNEFKLRIAYANYEGELIELGEEYFNENGDNYAIYLQSMYSEMEKVFGYNTKYTPGNFTALDDDFGTGNGYPFFKYNKEKLRFETNFEFGGSIKGFVNQKLIRAEGFQDELYLYVVPAYYKLQYSKYNDELYDVFSDYDYISRKYSNSLKEKVEYTEEINEDLIDKLDTYKYTFKYDDVDYFLVRIDKLGK